MNVTSLMLLAATLSGTPQAHAVAPGELRIGGNFDRQVGPPERRAERAQPPPDRPHQLGVGSSISAGTGGVGGAMRVFFNDRVGVDFVASWYNPHTRNTAGSTVNVTPSFQVMLRSPNDKASVDIRPYVGGGLSYVYSSYHVAGAAYNGSSNGVGSQAYGGAEITFHEAQWLTISGEVRYYSLPVRTVNTNMIDGVNYNMMFHFYMR